MRLLLLGATGRTGREILDLALSRGHHVTAFVRSPHKLQTAASLRVVAGDPRRRDLLADEMAGHDAVLSAIGPPPGEALRSGTSLVADCARALVGAMVETQVDRLAILSAAVLFPERGPYFAFFQWLLRHHARDLRAMEALVESSGLNWTIARPPRLTASASPTYVAAPAAFPRGRRVMSFGAVARFMVDAVEQRAYVGQVVGLAGGRV
jgi:putative NADH-flavin reductase